MSNTEVKVLRGAGQQSGAAFASGRLRLSCWHGPESLPKRSQYTLKRAILQGHLSESCHQQPTEAIIPTGSCVRAWNPASMSAGWRSQALQKSRAPDLLRERQGPTEQAEVVEGPEANEGSGLLQCLKEFAGPRAAAVEPGDQIRGRGDRPTAGGGERECNRSLRVREVPVRRSP